MARETKIMNRNPMTRSRAALPALLVVAGFAALQGASGCGKAGSLRTDSETHWLASCDTYLDCATGSCECGVCTTPCTSGADCSALGFAGVECVPQSGICGGSVGSTAAASSACLLSCLDDTDCSPLGSGAVCESQRCELPASAFEPVGATDSTSAAVLCDGSDDVRFLWVAGASDGITEYSGFAQLRGGGFLAIDGQCRFWSAREAARPVTSGTLSAEDAAAFARAIGYERFAEYTPLDDAPDGCTGLGITRIWSPASRAHCSCGCYEDPRAVGWLRVLEAMLDPGVQGLFANGQTLAGPLRLALIGYPGVMDGDAFTVLYVPEPWPLSRAPAGNETYYAVASNPPPIDESSGVEITEPGELAALRAARDTYSARDSGPTFTPLVWTDPDTQQSVWFHMLLR
ncbi:MAG TPA: hypothetical protein VJU61_15940, partial [Polyangiaceae bacterium]|nr:hypothetical protein [Polyangiaceae bacterium]